MQTLFTAGQVHSSTTANRESGKEEDLPAGELELQSVKRHKQEYNFQSTRFSHLWYMEVQQQGQNRAMRPMTNVLPSSVNRIKEATKIYTESIKKNQGYEKPNASNFTGREPRRTFNCRHNKHTWIRSAVLHNRIYQTRKEACHGYPSRWQEDLRRNWVVTALITQIM